MILILGGAWQGKLTWAASHGMVGPVFDLKDGWPEAPVRCCRHLEALTRAASDHGETAQQVLDRVAELKEISGNRDMTQGGTAGAVLQGLAARAEHVSRIFCGLEERLK